MSMQRSISRSAVRTVSGEPVFISSVIYSGLIEEPHPTANQVGTRYSAGGGCCCLFIDAQGILVNRPHNGPPFTPLPTPFGGFEQDSMVYAVRQCEGPETHESIRNRATPFTRSAAMREGLSSASLTDCKFRRAPWSAHG